MTPTERFIGTLEALKPGDLCRLRNHAGLSVDESVGGFDLFAGLWWPLRQKNQHAPRREVAWLVAKLYAFCPIPQLSGASLAVCLGKIKSTNERVTRRRQQRFDELLAHDLSGVEFALKWALQLIEKNNKGIDWVRLTDELSVWEREETRLSWAKQYLQLEN